MEKKQLLLCIIFLACKQDYGNLTYTAKLPRLLKEVSGIEYSTSKKAFWMLNDSGNKSSIYLISKTGKVLQEVTIDANNTDWEDIAQDTYGNLYVGDFGNNYNQRKDLTILRLDANQLDAKQKGTVQKTFFSFPEQKKFPPKKMYYDVEAFFEHQGFFYVFTKSRVKNKIGRTFLYKIPNKAGSFKAERISDFTTCKGKGCWITGADITADGKKVVLVNHKSAWVFTHFKKDDFFSGKAKEYKFKHNSQKESVTFASNTQIFIADENEAGTSRGRNLYSIYID